jgi:predicted PurR-regulated permease PerM
MSASEEEKPLAWSRWPELGYVAAATFVVALVWGIAGVLADRLELLFLSFLGILLAAVMEYPVRFLSRWLPRAVSAGITLLGAFGVIVLLVYLSIPIVTEQGGQLVQQVPQAIDQVNRWLSRFEGRALRQLPQGRQLMESLEHMAVEKLGKLASSAIPLATGVISVVSGIVLLLVLAAFLAYEPRTYVNGLMRLTPKRYMRALVEFLSLLGGTIQRWMLGTVVAMTIIGVVTAVGLLILGIESWFVLALLAFFGEFVPNAGPVVTAIPAIAVGLTHSPQMGLYVALFYLAVQQLESNLIQPVIMREAVSLHPALLLVWQLMFASAFGILGLLISTPLLACLKVGVEFFYVEKTLGKPESPSIRPDGDEK